QRVADLVARPALRPPGPHLSQPAAARAVDHREHAEALQGPGAGLLQEAAPGGRAGDMAADVAGGLFVGVELGEAVEVLGPREAEDEAVGFKHWTGVGHFEALTPALSRKRERGQCAF